MSRTRIKICGITDPDAARAAAESGADAVGLAFVASSPRALDEATAAHVIAALPPFVEPVGLFADASAPAVQATAGRLGLTMVQLHGSETPADASRLAPLRVLRALPFDEHLAERLPEWAEVGNLAGLLIDAPPPLDAERSGGHGRAYDARALARTVADVRRELPPMVLAGGLTADNVAAAIAAARPWAVDVSSGVEGAPARKSPERIRAFCAAVRAADAG